MTDEEREYAYEEFGCKAMSDKQLICALKQQQDEREIECDRLAGKAKLGHNFAVNWTVSLMMSYQLDKLNRFLKELNHE